MTLNMPRYHSRLAKRMKAKVEHIEQVEIPDLQRAGDAARSEGRYATGAAFTRLVWELMSDVEAYKRSIDFHLDAIARGK